MSLPRLAAAAGEYQIGRITRKASINFGYPVLDEADRVQAVVVAALDLAWLNQLAAEARLPRGSTFTVIDRQGVILARYPDPEKWLGQFLPEASIVQTILAQREGVREAPEVEGVPRLFTFTPLRGARGPETCTSASASLERSRLLRPTEFLPATSLG